MQITGIFKKLQKSPNGDGRSEYCMVHICLLTTVSRKLRSIAKKEIPTASQQIVMKFIIT